MMAFHENGWIILRTSGRHTLGLAATMEKT